MTGLLKRLRGDGGEDSTTDSDTITDPTGQSRGELITTPEYTRTIRKPVTRRTDRFHFVRGDPVDVTYDKTVQRKVNGISKTEYHKGVEKMTFDTRRYTSDVWPSIYNIKIDESAEHLETIIDGNVSHITHLSEEQMLLEQDVACITIYWENTPEDARARLEHRVGDPRIVPADE